MSNGFETPYAWDSLDKNILKKSFELIERLSPQEIENLVVNYCKNHLGCNNLESQDYLINTHSLLGVEGSIIEVRFNVIPANFVEGGIQIAGMARLIETENGTLPVVLLFPSSNEETLEHERIHLCQWLNDKTFQLTLGERKEFLQQKLCASMKRVIEENPENALDLFIRITNYKVWIELEANHFSKRAFSNRSVLDKAQRSSQPFSAIEHGLDELGFTKIFPEAKSMCKRAFVEFCNDLELHVDWIRDLVAESKSETLYDALWWCKMDYETELMTGFINGEGHESYFMRRMHEKNYIDYETGYIDPDVDFEEEWLKMEMGYSMYEDDEDSDY